MGGTSLKFSHHHRHHHRHHLTSPHVTLPHVYLQGWTRPMNKYRLVAKKGEGTFSEVSREKSREQRA
jgi:hypothetical protein